MASEIMQQLSTATSFKSHGDTHLIKVSYQMGAQFEGQLVDHKRSGRGIFMWPNGSKYEGDYLENLRHGKGTQIWCDGSSYTGEFVKDLRHGQGCLQWSNGEIYEGTFFKDRRHGKGTYKWPDGSSFSGTFYMDKKEGYGSFHFPSGDFFQGLYLEDEREGPGVMTYQNGHQDLGFWRGENLIKLCSEIKGGFTMKSHPEFEFRIEDHVVYVDMDDGYQALAPVESILNPPTVFDYPPKPDLSQRVSELYNEALDPRSLAVDRQTFDREFFKDVPDNAHRQETVVVWNLTPDMIALQKHTLKHMFGKHELNVDIDAIIRLDRINFKQSGQLEQMSEQVIIAAEVGDAETVERLLDSRTLHPDVSDCHGHTALIGATVNWHTNIINILLNHGANVNRVNDEGCSALAAGVILYYPIEGFVHNIAEEYAESSLELKVLDSKKDALHNDTVAKARKVSELNEINQKKSLPMFESKSHKEESKNVAVVPNSEVDKGLLEKVSSANDDTLNNEVADLPHDDDSDGELGAFHEDTDPEDLHEEEGPEDFESNRSMKNYHIDISNELLERCATELSHNEFVMNREVSGVGDMGKVRLLALQMSRHERMKQTLQLLLRRGADPNISCVPMPVLFFAIKSADVDMVRLLLLKGADTNVRLSKEKGGLYPIHIASALPGDEGVQITELLLNALADPNARAEEDDSFQSNFLAEEWSKDVVSESSKARLGGRTALQIACARDDDYKNAGKIVRLLLEHKADTSLMCNGFSPLALAIASGNDVAVDELLLFGADPSLPLTHGVGNAICVATNTQYEHRRTLQGRMQLLSKLINAGADVLAPICIGPKRLTGTAVDYAYYMFNQDRRIAHVPYHALTHSERETYNARRKLLAHIGEVTRFKAVEREKRRNLEEEMDGTRTRSPSLNFLYIGAGAKLPPGVRIKSASKGSHDQVIFESSEKEKGMRAQSPKRKPLFKYCYECGRSVGVRLTACTRCKEVYYCSNACKLKAWNDRHKDECIRIEGQSRSPSPKHKAGSQVPVSATNKGTTGFQKVNSSQPPTKGGPGKGLEGEKKSWRRKFRTGSPPNYEYVYIDNYSHN